MKKRNKKKDLQGYHEYDSFHIFRFFARFGSDLFFPFFLFCGSALIVRKTKSFILVNPETTEQDDEDEQER